MNAQLLEQPPQLAESLRVREHFDANAATYFEMHSGEAGTAREIRDRYLAALAPRLNGANALDVACGPGNFAAWTACRLRGAVVGVDFSPAMIELARERFPNVTFVVGDVHRLPFADREFDIVYSFRSLQHVPGMESALSEMARVTTFGGTVLFDFVNNRNPLGLLREKASLSRRFIYLKAHSRREIGVLCRRQGLAIKEWVPLQLLADSANARKYFGSFPLRWVPRLCERANSWADRWPWLGGFALRMLVVAEKARSATAGAPSTKRTGFDDSVHRTAT